MRYRNLGVHGFLLLAFLLFPATVLATSVQGTVINGIEVPSSDLSPERSRTSPNKIVSPAATWPITA